MTQEHKQLQKKYDFLIAQMESFIKSTNNMADEDEKDAKKDIIGMKSWLDGRVKAYRNCSDSVQERMESVERYFKFIQ